jgi:antitoxin component YwqK of YwqJK toxin-antitoxin module
VADDDQVEFGEFDWDQDQRVVTAGGRYTGEAVERDSRGNVIAVVSYRDGFKDGPETHHYPNGQLAFQGTWRWGAGGVGVHRSWFANGQLKEEALYNERGYVERINRFGEDGSPAG